jgi:hypothetical protein
VILSGRASKGALRSRDPAIAECQTLTADRSHLEAVKTVALATGVRVSDAVLGDFGGPAALTIHEYATTGGITLELPQGVIVNAPFDDPFCAESSLELRRDGDRLSLRLREISVPVISVLPLPGYLRELDAQGRSVADIAMSHADRIRVSPIVGCAYDCRFCDLASLRYRPRPIDQILAALDVARSDTALPPRHLLISGGSPGRAQPQQDYFREVCLAVLDHVRATENPSSAPFSVDIMMSAREDGPEFVDAMVDAGIYGFSFNIEVFSETAARAHLPLKHKLARPMLEAMISRAVERVGRTGRVRSLIIAGLESVQETLEGIEWLATLGCDPVLSPFRPARGTALADAPPPSAEDLSEILIQARRIVARHGVALGPRCVPCQHNTLTFPWDVPALDRIPA